ncbi:MAG: hypothetical protein J6B07_05200 [Opitutales bacterium]|nr:hypothetical protein [Opitutales bacterium]
MTILAASAVAALCFYSEWQGMVEENEQLRKHQKDLQARVDDLQKDWEYKNEYYNRLISDPEFVERVIKNKLGYANSEDFVFRFKDSETVDSADNPEKNDFIAPTLPVRKNLFTKIKEFFGFGQKSSVVVQNSLASNDKNVKPAYRVDIANASSEVDKNKKRLLQGIEKSVMINDKNNLLGNSMTLPLPEGVSLNSDTVKGSLQEAEMRPVKIKLGGTNVSVKRVAVVPFKSVRFISRQ